MDKSGGWCFTKTRCKKGDYVLAPKYSDGNCADHWAVGFYNGLLIDDPEERNNRHMVVDNEGNNFRGNGFRKVGLISDEEGKALLRHAKELEAARIRLWPLLRKLRKDKDYLISLLDA